MRNYKFWDKSMRNYKLDYLILDTFHKNDPFWREVVRYEVVEMDYNGNLELCKDVEAEIDDVFDRYYYPKIKNGNDLHHLSASSKEAVILMLDNYYEHYTDLKFEQYSNIASDYLFAALTNKMDDCLSCQIKLENLLDKCKDNTCYPSFIYTDIENIMQAIDDGVFNDKENVNLLKNFFNKYRKKYEHNLKIEEPIEEPIEIQEDDKDLITFLPILDKETGRMVDGFAFIDDYEKICKEIEPEIIKEIGEWIDYGMGYCHLYWKVKKRILREKYKINWRTPSELNPNIL